LASDNDDKAELVAPPPQDSDENPAENPPEKLENKMERTEKPTERSEKPLDKPEKLQESKSPDGNKAQESKPAAEGADKQERPPTGPPGHRRKQGQNQKNGSPTLDLVELKDMSIQKLNQVAKDLSVTGAAGLRKQELIFKVSDAGGEERADLFRGRSRVPAGQLRLLRAPEYGYLPGRRRIRLAIANPPL
jgi:transcription termination factor Rho